MDASSCSLMACMCLLLTSPPTHSALPFSQSQSRCQIWGRKRYERSEKEKCNKCDVSSGEPCNSVSQTYSVCESQRVMWKIGTDRFCRGCWDFATEMIGFWPWAFSAAIEIKSSQLTFFPQFNLCIKVNTRAFRVMIMYIMLHWKKCWQQWKNTW